MTESVEALLVLAPEPRASSASRRFVTDALARWELGELTDTAALLTSELVTNAIVHAQTEIAVSIRRETPTTVTIAVQDGSPVPPRMAFHDEDSTSGRGIEILNQLAASWQIVPQPSGKTVLFTLSL